MGEDSVAIAPTDEPWLRASSAWWRSDSGCNDRRGLTASAGENMMRPLLAISQAIDQINEKIGYICNLLVLVACLVSAGNAMIRYAFGYSSNGWLELQWYMFAILVMFGASYTFKRNEHVRVEIFYLFLSERGQLWLDLIGTLFFLIPSCLLLSYLSWPFFHQAYAVGEMSGNAGGLIRWPIKFVIPSGFVMLALQGVSEVIKRIAALQGQVTIDAKYERPTQ
jgi:TRAP-type mannitol/chloroaromatic compound transport system permease small subunit